MTSISTFHFLQPSPTVPRWPQALWMFQHAQRSAIHTADVCHLPLSSWASGSRWMEAGSTIPPRVAFTLVRSEHCEWYSFVCYVGVLGFAFSPGSMFPKQLCEEDNKTTIFLRRWQHEFFKTWRLIRRFQLYSRQAVGFLTSIGFVPRYLGGNGR